MRLTIAMNAADPLLHIHRVPRQVEIEQYAGELEIDAFTPCRRANEHSRPIFRFEASFRRDFRAVIAAAQHYDALAGINLLDLVREQVDGAEVRRENHDFLVRVLPP